MLPAARISASPSSAPERGSQGQHCMYVLTKRGPDRDADFCGHNSPATASSPATRRAALTGPLNVTSSPSSFQGREALLVGRPALPGKGRHTNLLPRDTEDTLWTHFAFLLGPVVGKGVASVLVFRTQGAVNRDSKRGWVCTRNRARSCLTHAKEREANTGAGLGGRLGSVQAGDREAPCVPAHRDPERPGEKARGGCACFHQVQGRRSQPVIHEGKAAMSKPSMVLKLLLE